MAWHHSTLQGLAGVYAGYGGSTINRMSVMWSQFQPVRSATPVYVQLADWIADRITSGELQPGEQLPAERQLAELIGHAPETVSKAKRVLVDRGLVESTQGVGTFVRRQG